MKYLSAQGPWESHTQSSKREPWMQPPKVPQPYAGTEKLSGQEKENKKDFRFFVYELMGQKII